MIRAIMNGCHGVMGHVITDIISKDDAIEIVARRGYEHRNLRRISGIQISR